MEKERLRLMVKVCQLYFHEGLNQQSIANKYGISRTQVSRMISQAKNEGVVEVRIRNPFSNEAAVERELLKRFNLRDVIVVDTDKSDTGRSDDLLAKAGAAFLETVFNDGDVIGVMAGKSINKLANELKETQRKELKFVPLIGGWGAEGVNWHSNSNASLMAEQMKGSHFLLHSPAIVSSVETRFLLMEEREIQNVITMASNANVAIIGIGEIAESATFVQSINLNESELSSIAIAGAVGSICTSFINEKGEEVAMDLSAKMIGLSGESLKKIPQVIALARGAVKADAIHASLTGSWVDVLITDMETAQIIIEKEKIIGGK
ncbi:MAG: sugar-binding transcriptional regulator [Bacillus sp. (in: Bacteria)]|nr:sugar-binding transcriptional regulator [Bacillus sp. (in: firmicutes)]